MPTTFVRLARDNALPPPTQDGCIARLRHDMDVVDVIEIDSGHDVMISAPAALAAVLEPIAAAAT
jgi:pimeloyl-ACP methyl ester carboxylesterase